MRYCAGLLFPNYTDDLGKVSYVVVETRNDREYVIMLPPATVLEITVNTYVVLTAGPILKMI